MEETSSPKLPGALYVIATPIGNMEDITFRAVRILGNLDALACEDTRFTRRIFQRYEIPSPRTIFSYHDHNEDRSGKRILGLLADGQSVGICSDGGFPGVSDPGYRIVSQALEAGYSIEVLPGASAVHTALLASGLPTSSYTFKGFPPRKPGKRKKFLEAEKELPHSLIFFESPFRLAKLLSEALEVYGNRNAAVCIEMTKKFEDIHRGTLEQLHSHFETQQPKGEVTVAIEGNKPRQDRKKSEAPGPFDIC